MRMIKIVLIAGLLFNNFAPPAYAQIPADLAKSFRVTITNPSKTEARENVLIAIPTAALQKVRDFNAKAFVVTDNGKEIPSQFSISGPHAGIVTVIDQLKPSEVRTLTVRFKTNGEYTGSYTKRTQAELAHKKGGKFVNREYIGGAFENVTSLHVPAEHKDHSWFIRYEGPGWESDLVGYRFYLDQRNATDVFGKKTTAMVLQQVGLDGFDSYHEMQPWGMDVMKVGKSLGLGSPGAWRKKAAQRIEKTDSVSCNITSNGVVYSSIHTNYFGWNTGTQKLNVTSDISIHAGTRLTHQLLKFSGDIDSLCTGIVKDKAARLYTSKGDASHFGYIATYGDQSLNKDGLGLAVFFDPRNGLGFTADENSDVILLKPIDGTLAYYFMASWVQEPQAFASEAAFLDYVKKTAAGLSVSVKVSIP
jgi:hypothetical protein